MQAAVSDLLAVQMWAIKVAIVQCSKTKACKYEARTWEIAVADTVDRFDRDSQSYYAIDSVNFPAVAFPRVTFTSLIITRTKALVGNLACINCAMHAAVAFAPLITKENQS